MENKKVIFFFFFFFLGWMEGREEGEIDCNFRRRRGKYFFLSPSTPG
jgi:hypothetical protein